MPFVKNKRGARIFVEEGESTAGEDFVYQAMSDMRLQPGVPPVESHRGRDLTAAEIEAGVTKNVWGKTNNSLSQNLDPETDPRGVQHPFGQTFDRDTQHLVDKAKRSGLFGKER